MRIILSDSAWDDYIYWMQVDGNAIKQVKKLIKSICCTPFEGIGNPEPLKYNLSGFWSRRINAEHRLVYQVDGDCLLIASCRYHY
ncbi:Txe/YoeB family addiction module toxin (plasmid) [Edwardsiella tarda]|uniref:Txe/YoeB family addiction module toxin n=1 Tax=Edwardsiella tarda TaxID=636 RepID=UPI000D51D722|nr:Txe/YoeB family addiction module toxin [Edwardsiella tarda]UCQ29574.1 Txe/YoeB family addiction module toxin [Edwardsiella tarda]